MRAERFGFSWLKTAWEEGRPVGGQRMVLDTGCVSAPRLAPCAWPTAQLQRWGSWERMLSPASVSPLRVQEKGPFGAAERKRGQRVGLSCQHLGACSGWLSFPLGWLFIRKEAGSGGRAS